MKAIKRTLVEDALTSANLYEGEDGDASIRADYSGRSMYGRTCFGVTFNRESDSYKFLVGLALCLAAEDEDDGEEQAIDLAEAATTDSMGLGMILYFPGYVLAE